LLQKPHMYGVGPSRKPDSALRSLRGSEWSEDFRGCWAGAETGRAFFKPVGVKLGVKRFSQCS
jgi:hypothetical protein